VSADSHRVVADSYRIVLPEAWRRIPLGGDLRAEAGALLAGALQDLPAGVSPDAIAPHRARAEHELRRRLEDAREHGGIDYYLPTELMHGVRIPANFVVHLVLPDALTSEEEVPQIMAALLRQGSSRAVTIDDTVWVRTEEEIKGGADQRVPEEVRARKVQYVTALPGDSRRWVLVSFSGLTSDHDEAGIGALAAELFDAIMGTWRWQGEGYGPGQ
jgi:hypothetical protein